MYVHITQPLKKNEIMPFAATWMDLEIFILSEVSQKEKDKYCMLLLIHGILKNDTNELIYKTETDSQISKNKLIVTKMERQFSSVQFTRSVVSDYLRPHEPQHTRPPCPSPTPGVHSDSCPSSQ